MDKAAFRARFTEFANTTNYPDAMLDSWALVAEQLLPSDIWGDTWTFGVQLYVAHEITIERQNAATAANGGVPGLAGGVQASKTVGAASVSYDTNNASEKNAGWWNLTTYGRQLYRLIRIFGAGCVQL